MALIKRPPETIERRIRLDRPGSQLLDDYTRFVNCTPDYVTNFALGRMLARDPEYRKWKRSHNAAAPPKGTPAATLGLKAS